MEVILSEHLLCAKNRLGACFKDLFIFLFYMYECFACSCICICVCVYVYALTLCILPLRGQERVPESPELELRTDVSFHESAGNQGQVLQEEQCS